MPVPQSWTDLSIVAASNSPAGTEAVGTQMDDYLRSHAAFLKQLHDGWIARDGTVAMTGALNMGGQRILNVGNPNLATDAANKSYVDTQLLVLLPRATVIMWWGASNMIPPGWVVCDGTNGTPDMRDRVPYGAGGSQSGPAYGGSNTITLGIAQLPPHSHSVYDPQHGHGIYDPTHGHGINDPQHGHGLVNQGSVQAGADNGGAQCPVATGYSSGRAQVGTSPSGTGISIYNSGTGISVNAAATGISLYNTGSGAAIDIRQSYTALFFIMKV